MTAPSNPVASRGGFSSARGRTLNLEVLSKTPACPRAAPPILFVHGCWHAAWCWDEHFLDYFAANGFAAYALSLRGHGASEGRERLRWTRVRDFVQDLAQVAAALPAPPVLVGHSTGGFVVQKYLEKHQAPAAVLLGSVPPSGELPIVLRLARNRPIDVLIANLKLSLWPIISNPRKAQALLFSSRMPLAEAARFHGLLQDDSVLGFLDCLMFDLVRTKRISSPILVMGAEEDAMVTAKEVHATASAYNAKTTFFKHVAHDMMLDPDWRGVADTIIAELDLLFPEGEPRLRLERSAA